MKKRIAVALALCILCAACTGTVANAEGAKIRPNEMRRTYTVSGVALTELQADLPQLSGMDADVAERIRKEIEAFILAEGGFDDACEIALEDYTDNPERFATTERYGLDAVIEVTLRTEALLALRYDFTFRSGGPHPWDTIAAQHYDLRTGAPVPLEALVKDPAAFQEKVARIIYQGLAAEEYSEFDGGDADPSEWPLEQGLLTAEGLRVFYQEGELGGTYAGPFELLIPYDRLAGLFVDGLGIGSDGETGLETEGSIATDLPIGAEQVFADARWAGYERVSTGFYREASQPRTVVAVLRKGEQNVLCVLRWSSTQQGYIVVVENDRALYPGQLTPAIGYDPEGETSLITIEYGADPAGGLPQRRGFSFYDDEEYTFLWAYRDVPNDHSDPDGFQWDIQRFRVAEENGNLVLSVIGFDYGNEWDDTAEFLTPVKGDARLCALAEFDLTKFDEAFDTAMAEIAEQTDYGTEGC